LLSFFSTIFERISFIFSQNYFHSAFIMFSSSIICKFL
jgi:hypothetical protein